MQGVKILYDSFFKEILNPDTAPSRLEELLSLILQRHIRILHVLPNDSSRIAEENALLIMDIVVQLEDGSPYHTLHVLLFSVPQFSYG